MPFSPDACVKHVIEYQGSGYHQGTATSREAMKKAAPRGGGHRLSRGRRGTHESGRVPAEAREVGAGGLNWYKAPN